MSLLVIQIPARSRLLSHAAGGPDTARPAAGEGLRYVLSPDGLQVASHGRAAAAILPKADSVVAVVADSDLSWQRITLPKAPAARLRAALGGMLEEHLLEDDEDLHFALAPRPVATQPVWVAVMNKAWLRAELDALERAGLSIERVVPSSWPGDSPQGHFFEDATQAAGSDRILLSYADANGQANVRLDGTLARALLPQMRAQATRWTATPAVAAQAERWLGENVNVLTEDERALQCARSLWNLRQFDLAPRHRGTRALRDAARQFLSPAWRPVRAGLAALALVQLAGLNAWAWHQRQGISAMQQSQDALLRSTYPQVRAVLDAPAQMQRQTELLRAAAGRAGDNDLETLLGVAAAAWPDGLGPIQTLRFEPGRLTLAAGALSEAQAALLRDRLRPGGWAVEIAEGRITLSRATAARAGS